MRKTQLRKVRESVKKISDALKTEEPIQYPVDFCATPHATQISYGGKVMHVFN